MKSKTTNTIKCKKAKMLIRKAFLENNVSSGNKARKLALASCNVKKLNRKENDNVDKDKEKNISKSKAKVEKIKTMNKVNLKKCVKKYKALAQEDLINGKAKEALKHNNIAKICEKSLSFKDPYQSHLNQPDLILSSEIDN